MLENLLSDLRNWGRRNYLALGFLGAAALFSAGCGGGGSVTLNNPVVPGDQAPVIEEVHLRTTDGRNKEIYGVCRGGDVKLEVKVNDHGENDVTSARVNFEGVDYILVKNGDIYSVPVTTSPGSTQGEKNATFTIRDSNNTVTGVLGYKMCANEADADIAINEVLTELKNGGQINDYTINQRVTAGPAEYRVDALVVKNDMTDHSIDAQGYNEEFEEYSQTKVDDLQNYNFLNNTHLFNGTTEEIKQAIRDELAKGFPTAKIDLSQ